MRRLTPVVLGLGATLGALLFVLPIGALLWRAPWADLPAQLSAPETLQALRLSLVTSLMATAITIVLGTPLAWLQARSNVPGIGILRAVTTLPMVLPPVVGGVALLFAFGRHGLAGQWLDRAGVQLAFSTAGVVLAETFVAMPFFVVSVEAGLRAVDRRFEEVAQTLGAGPWRVAFAVTLPLARQSIVAGALLCWARALGEFGATITFAGNFPGRTQTLPLAVYSTLETRPEGAISLSLLLVAVAVVVMVALRGNWLRLR